MKKNYILGSFAILFAAVSMNAQSYCIPPGFKPMGGSGEPFTYISNVSLENLNNSSGIPTGIGDDNGYTHFTNVVKPVLEPGKYYQLKVTAVDNLGSGMEVAVWIDWNGDKEFHNISEKVAYWAPDGQHGVDIGVPANAKLGEIRMRVACDMPPSMGHIPLEPCGYLNYPTHAIGQHGEVEDYTLVVGNFTGINDVDAEEEITLYPVPADRILNLNHSMKETMNYRIADVFGRIVQQGRLEQASRSINVGNLNNGQYILLIQSESNLVRKPFSISH